MKPRDQGQWPFFAKFLEAQAQDAQLTSKLADEVTTLKFPSDGDDD